MEANLQAINRWIEDHHIDLLMPDQDFSRLTSTRDNGLDEFGDEKENSLNIDLNFRKSLYPVFNNGRLTDGGRFYGGWWQEIPASDRKLLTINWYPTAELDFSNMQIAMLYAGEGLALEGDAYSINGIGPEHRSLIKRTLLKIINATNRFRHPRRIELPPGWTSRQIVEALEEKHAPIARHFRTGVGVQLQRRDADIAERVMLTLMAEGILALPIHDSFVVVEGHQARLQQVMLDEYRSMFGQDVAIQADATLFQELPRDDELARNFGFANFDEYRLALDQDGIRALEENITDIENRQEYVQYRLRKNGFFQLKGEGWGHRHHFLY